jgi:hypothetical protein
VALSILVVVLLVAGSGLYLVLSTPASVEVTALLIWAPDNVCGLAANPGYYAGFNSSVGSSVSLTLGVPNYNSSACTISALSTNTTGFSLGKVGVPLAIVSGATGSLNVTVDLPGSAYAGSVNLVFA